MGSKGPSDNTFVKMLITPLYSSLKKRRERQKQQQERRRTRQKDRECMFVCVHIGRRERDRQGRK